MTPAEINVATYLTNWQKELMEIDRKTPHEAALLEELFDRVNALIGKAQHD